MLSTENTWARRLAGTIYRRLLGHDSPPHVRYTVTSQTIDVSGHKVTLRTEPDGTWTAACPARAISITRHTFCEADVAIRQALAAE